MKSIFIGAFFILFGPFNAYFWESPDLQAIYPYEAPVKILENFCRTPKASPLNPKGSIKPWLKINGLETLIKTGNIHKTKFAFSAK